MEAMIHSTWFEVIKLGFEFGIGWTVGAWLVTKIFGFFKV